MCLLLYISSIMNITSLLNKTAIVWQDVFDYHEVVSTAQLIRPLWYNMQYEYNMHLWCSYRLTYILVWRCLEWSIWVQSNAFELQRAGVWLRHVIQGRAVLTCPCVLLDKSIWNTLSWECGQYNIHFSGEDCVWILLPWLSVVFLFSITCKAVTVFFFY